MADDYPNTGDTGVPSSDPDSAWDYIIAGEGKDIGTALMAGLAGLVYAVWSGVINITNTSLEVIYRPLVVLLGDPPTATTPGSGVLGVVGQIWMGWVEILDQANAVAVDAFGFGGSADVGPFTQIFGLVVVFIGAYVVILYLSQQFSSSTTPTGLVDIPVISWFTTTPEEEDADDTD